MIVGVPKETSAGERRVALVPDLVPKLVSAGMQVHVQADAGADAGFPDSAYAEKGATVQDDVFAQADIVLKVRPLSSDEIQRIKPTATVIGFLYPYTNLQGIEAMATRGIVSFAMELMPRITRAQPMDALSAMSTVAGYKAVVIAADRLPKLFPLMMTAAGTVTPAHVFIIGAGVAGLQAIGTAKRLGAVVEAYDTRPAVKEQVESLGAKFVELGLETASAEDKGGYAKAMSDEFYDRQRAMMAKVVAASDVVISTALVPGKPAPVLISQEAVAGMRPGSVLVDLAAEAGGNCALTVPGEEVVRHGVTIVGPMNLPSSVPFHASQMYARTVMNYLLHLVKKGEMRLDLADELTRGPLVTQNGQVVHEVVRSQRERKE